jgi:signal peptidase
MKRGVTMQPRLKKILHFVILCVLAVVLGLKLYSWNAGTLTGNNMPMPFGFGMSVVLSGSMEPELNVDDLVLIHETKDITTGDIIVYEKNGELIIHRVIYVDQNTVITQGDANNVADDPFDISQVKGKLVGYIPGVGAIIRLIKMPVGTFALLAAAVILVELSYRREKRQDDKELEAIKEEIRNLKNARIDTNLEDR